MHHAREWLKLHRREVIEAAPVVFLLVLSQIEVWTTSLDVPKPLVALVAAATIVPLFWRRRYPLITTAVVLAGVIVTASVWALMDNFISPFGALLVAAYSGAAHQPPRTAWTVVGLVLGLMAVGAAIDGRPIGDVAFVDLIVAGVAAAGRSVHSRQQRVIALADQAVLLEHERDAKARAAVAEERLRIARELHDVVAHGISVIVLQARGGRKVLTAEESEARGAFEEIETTAQQALNEMRRLLGMLRQQDEDLSLGPAPSLANIGALATHVRDAGLPVDVIVKGDVDRVPPAVGLSAYRLVQEGLTNALKHAGPARARVFVNCANGEVEVEVIDDGRGVNGTGDRSGGHGLTGMRERVAMLGGQLEVGPREGGGFALRARLPLNGGR
jgi:signal transduction histidine kinase